LSAQHEFEVPLERDEHPKSDGPLAGGPLAAAICNEIVSFYRDHFGRGPTKAHAYVEEDVVLCVMREVSTIEDRELVDAGRADIARQARETIRESHAAELAALVERMVGRPVLCMLGDFDPHSDTVALVFPLASSGRSE
jgi:uncharacterized protein YbcI